MNLPTLVTIATALDPVGTMSNETLAKAARKYSKFKNRVLPHQHNGGDPIKVKTTQGRNELCACGSKKKFKTCCLLRPPIKQIMDETMAEKVESRLQGDV